MKGFGCKEMLRQGFLRPRAQGIADGGATTHKLSGTAAWKKTDPTEGAEASQI